MSAYKIQPEFLKPGDEVAIISPSFSIEEKKIVDAVSVLEKWGLRVHVGGNALKQSGPFAGTDEERLHDFQEMTNNPRIRAVFCSRGGYGISRIISKIDFSALKKNPKWYVGFSDITVLHMWLNEVIGVISIHGEMPVNYNNPEKTKGTFRSLQQALFGDLQSFKWEGAFFRPGNATGEITGGNLSLIYSLIGTPAEPVTDGKILFIEEVGEFFYHLDRIMISLKLAGKLEGLSALIVGGMNKIEETKTPWGKSIEETVFEIVRDYNFPLLFNFPAGHIANNRAFYIGRKAKIGVKGNKATLTYV
jgi:muramoyltetrapeptide carboxypeptidase